MFFAHLEDVLQLAGVGSEEGDVQETLGDGFLGGVFVGVEGFLEIM